jgi:hypothetical protein
MQVYFNSRLFLFAFKFEIIKKQHEQDASARCARLPGEPNHDLFYIRVSTQTDQNGPFAFDGIRRPAGDALIRTGWL